jgi:putative restriction endonuclease
MAIRIPERVFGHIPGYPEGSCFATRAAVAAAGLHRPPVAGIAGSGQYGATSVVIAGGYEDTEDFGDVILYTGHGGRDPETGRQRADQTLTRGNRALACNRLHGLPVRLIRGARHPSPYAPEAGYRYDGLYMVEDYWREVGKSGFHIWRFRLRKVSAPAAPGACTAGAGPVTALHTVRETENTPQGKALCHSHGQMYSADDELLMHSAVPG